MKKILFVHQTFPGQFKFLANSLVADGHDVSAITINNQSDNKFIKIYKYSPKRSSTKGIHPWLIDFESKLIRGESVFDLMIYLAQHGYQPDVVVGHSGWGELLFVKDVWPKAQLIIYSEFYYHATGWDLGFDPEFRKLDIYSNLVIKIKNLNNDLNLQICDLAVSPTNWQKKSYPEKFHEKIAVMHEGVDTDLCSPDDKEYFSLNENLNLDKTKKIITFVNRNLEPYRGYHSFMRSLPAVLEKFPDAHVLIVGGDGVSYGVGPSEGGKWKDIFWDEVRHKVDPTRVHFLGSLAYEDYLKVLKISTVHVYLTYPFVLGWSLLEAMSIGCAVVGSATGPVEEVISNNQNGILVNFFNYDELSNAIIMLLNDKDLRHRLGKCARDFVVSNYDRNTICIPKFKGVLRLN